MLTLNYPPTYLGYEPDRIRIVLSRFECQADYQRKITSED